MILQVNDVYILISGFAWIIVVDKENESKEFKKGWYNNEVM